MKEFSRYAIASALALLVDFGTLFILTKWLDFYYLLSATAGFCLGAAIAYTLSIKWVFAHRSVENSQQEFIIFIIIGILGLGLSILLIWFLTEITGMFYLYSKIVTTILVFLFNYTARRKLLFAPNLTSEIQEQQELSDLKI